MKLNAIFADGMVLQANRPIRVFGTGGGLLRIEFLGECFEKEMCAVEWCAELSARDYGGPYEMTIWLSGRKRVIRDIYIGDVYLMAGQSNMQMKLSETEDCHDLRTLPKVRLFTAERPEGGERFFPEDGWIPCSAETAPDWPAIAYLTGAKLAETRDTAIGFVGCYQGAAAIQSYLPESVFAEEPRFLIAEELRFDMEFFWNHGHSLLYHSMFETLVPFSFGGVVWYQGESNNSLPEAELYFDMLSALIRSWRTALGDERLPFVIIQIADYAPRLDTAWSLLQKAQERAAAEILAVRTVISRDVCEDDLIHPKKKAALSARVAEALMENDGNEQTV